MLSQRFGAAALGSFQDWQALVQDSANRTPPAQFRLVNDFFNRRIRFGEDQDIWGQSDYWATPMETLGRGAGDCEDFAIAKYFTLLPLSIPDKKMRLIYVQASLGGVNSSITQAHMVLAYYPTSDAEPLILDNLVTEVQPASRRPDLLPVFSLNAQGLWPKTGETIRHLAQDSHAVAAHIGDSDFALLLPVQANAREVPGKLLALFTAMTAALTTGAASAATGMGKLTLGQDLPSLMAQTFSALMAAQAYGADRVG